nr:unnamed protein product [Callosobruchus chinensis]
MSSEGDSSKSVLSEANEKSGTDNNTDDSQDSQDVSDAKAEKPATENNIDDKKDAKSEEESTEVDAKPNDSKNDDENGEPETKPEAENKVNNEVKNESKSEEDVESEDTEKSEKEEPEKNDKAKKKEKKEKKEEKSEDSENEEESDEDKSEKSEKEVPLLDQPLELSGKRERKNVQRFKEELPAKNDAKIEFAEGNGTALGDIPRIDASISRFKNDDLKFLHRLLFKVNGKSTLVKKNIRKFNGFNFDKESEEYQKKIGSAQKLDTKQLKSICEMLDLQKSGTKDDLANRIVEFLLEPKDSGKPVDGGRPKRSAAVKANNRGKRTNLKDDSSSDDEFQPEGSDNSDDKPRMNKRKRRGKKKSSDEEEISEASIGSSDESDDEPKQKRRKSTTKPNAKSKAKGTPGRRGRPSAASKKTPAKGRGRGRKKVSESEEEDSDKRDDGSSSEDEPLAKKAKSKEPPTDEEIKTFIKGILEGANLEEITMKTVCQRVYGHYPDFDLTHKKEFIKCTVKSIIST